MLATGCRRNEIGKLQWGEIGDERITISATRMKGGGKHEVPLLPLIAKLLPTRPKGASPQTFLFGRLRVKTGYNGWSFAKPILDKRMAALGVVDRWTLHDLRRTLSTRLNDAGVPPHVVEALLAHEVPGVAGVYNPCGISAAES